MLCFGSFGLPFQRVDLPTARLVGACGAGDERVGHNAWHEFRVSIGLPPANVHRCSGLFRAVASPALGRYHGRLPYLIDGNNVLFALAQAGVYVERGGLVGLLEGLAARENQHVTVVFDGAEHVDSPRDERADVRVRILYAAPRIADEIIESLIGSDSAPRRLTVVSSDHEILAAAHRRRCPGQTSEQFTRHLLQPPPHEAAPEAPERQGNLGPEETQRWLKEFGLDEADPK
ncbi:MAG: NYN domain-containing protein [Planctomycetota bacterium]|nr:NYN domain-containing protein [Planctomycetota bacterium]